MGKLIRLELYNFKSYKGHHVLQFGDSYFTSIIGPNGSGKSNSMDAISFVLGIKSTHLRSTHLRDLVYRGRVLKHSKIDANGDAVEENGEDAANGAAESDDGEDEEDTQDTQRNDPQTAWFMAVYEDDAGEEQRWKRSITSAGQSEYRINNRTVLAGAYNDALEAENILIKARNFLVFQGDVEAVASQSPKDLTRLLEQISGSLEYAKQDVSLKAEAARAESAQREKMDLRRSINTEIKAYNNRRTSWTTTSKSVPRRTRRSSQAFCTSCIISNAPSKTALPRFRSTKKSSRSSDEMSKSMKISLRRHNKIRPRSAAMLAKLSAKSSARRRVSRKRKMR